MAVANVFGMSSSKPAGCRLLLIAMERFLVGGVDESVEPFSLRQRRRGGGRCRRPPRDQRGCGSWLGDAVVGAVASQEHAEPFEGEPGDVQSGFDGLLAERFEQERFAGAGGHTRPGSPRGPDPFQGAERACWVGHGGWRTVRVARRGTFSPVGNPAAARRVARAERSRPWPPRRRVLSTLRWVPALTLGGGDHVGGVPADAAAGAYATMHRVPAGSGGAVGSRRQGRVWGWSRVHLLVAS